MIDAKATASGVGGKQSGKTGKAIKKVLLSYSRRSSIITREGSRYTRTEAIKKAPPPPSRRRYSFS
jgi:hypothetical protein